MVAATTWVLPGHQRQHQGGGLRSLHLFHARSHPRHGEQGDCQDTGTNVGRTVGGNHCKAIEHHWSRNVLVMQIESRLLERSGNGGMKMDRRYISHNRPRRHTPVEVGTIPVRSKSGAIRKPLQVEVRAFDEEAFREMVVKGTKAWADVSESWLENLRGNTDDE